MSSNSHQAARLILKVHRSTGLNGRQIAQAAGVEIDFEDMIEMAKTFRNGANKVQFLGLFR